MRTMSKESPESNFWGNEQILPEVKHESAEGVQSWPEVKVEITEREEENDCIENRIDDVSFEGEGDPEKKNKSRDYRKCRGESQSGKVVLE